MRDNDRLISIRVRIGIGHIVGSLFCFELDIGNMAKITGIVLAGGRASRMGRDKAFLVFDDKPLIEIMIDKLSSFFNDLIIVANNPLLYKKYNIRIEPDILKERGPLGGIYTGLVKSSNMYNFICPCDMPFINEDLIKYMLGVIDVYDVVVCEYKGKLEPLCAIYSKNCIKPIEKQLSKDNLKVTDFFKDVKVKIITENEVVRLDLNGSSFANMNTPEDYSKFKCRGI